MSASWTVYLLRCNDNSLYCGVTTDLDRRIKKHNAGTAAKYTRSRRPCVLVYQEPAADHSSALKREYAIKQLHKSVKESLIESVK